MNQGQKLYSLEALLPKSIPCVEHTMPFMAWFGNSATTSAKSPLRSLSHYLGMAHPETCLVGLGGFLEAKRARDTLLELRF